MANIFNNNNNTTATTTTTKQPRTSVWVELLSALKRWCMPHDMPQSLPATHRLALPVSKITSNDWGGVPIST